jgi:hypothetical protein
VSSPETVFFDYIWRLVDLLGWMFRVLARNIHPNVVILGPVSDAEIADPDTRGCLGPDTGVVSGPAAGAVRRRLGPPQCRHPYCRSL